MRLDPARREVGLHVGRGVHAAQPDVVEVALQHRPQLGAVEEMEVEGVLEVGRLVRGQHADHAVVLEHPGHLGHVGLGVGEVLDEVRRAGAVEAGGREAEVEGVHLRHPETVGAVAGGGRGGGLGGVVDADDLAAWARKRADSKPWPQPTSRMRPWPMRSSTAR